MTKLIGDKNQDFLPVTIRPAQEKDTPQVIGLTSQIWDGEDYVPEVWSEWLQDAQGILIVAENNDQVLGTAKLSLLTTDQWWLEGLRVDPRYQGKGIASQIHHFLINYWEQNCGGIVRLATISTRTQVHHLCEKSGFLKTGEFLFYSMDLTNASSEKLSGNPFSAVKDEEVQEALEFIIHSDTYIKSGSVMDFGWKWAIPDFHLIQEAVVENYVYWHGDRSVLVFCTEILENTDNSKFHIRSIASKFKNVGSCLTDLHQLIIQKNFHNIEWMLPFNPRLLKTIEQSGFKRDGDESMYIYEKRA